MKKEQILYMIIGFMTAVIIMLGIVVGVLLFNKSDDGNDSLFAKEKTTQQDKENKEKKDKKDKDKKEKKEDITESDKKDLFANEVGKDSSSEQIAVAFVVDGYEFVCPGDYVCTYFDGVGPAIYVSDIFQMKIVVRDSSYEDSMKDPAALTKKTIDAGGEILKDVTETTVNGTTYAYFKMHLKGDDCVVAFAKAPNSDKSFGGQVVLLDEEMTDEEALAIFDKVVQTAKETDKPNSTYDDISNAYVPVYHPGEEKSESQLKYNGEKVTFEVPEGFYSTYADAEGSYATESFSTDGVTVTVDTQLYPADFGYEGVDQYMDSELDDLETLTKGKKKIKIETDKIDGRKVYYIVTSYQSDDSENYVVRAACELKSGGIYSIRAFSFDEDNVDLTWDMVKGFMKIKEK